MNKADKKQMLEYIDKPMSVWVETAKIKTILMKDNNTKKIIKIKKKVQNKENNKMKFLMH